MRNATPSICVVGGGFTGVAATIACLRRVNRPFRLILVEPSAALGGGVAFGGQDPLHLLNVRARDLSIYADRPSDFSSWAFRQLDQGENDDALHAGLAHAFLPRQLFGEYVRQQFYEMVARRKDVDLHHVSCVATACIADKGCFQVHLDRSDLYYGRCRDPRHSLWTPDSTHRSPRAVRQFGKRAAAESRLDSADRVWADHGRCTVGRAAGGVSWQGDRYLPARTIAPATRTQRCHPAGGWVTSL